MKTAISTIAILVATCAFGQVIDSKNQSVQLASGVTIRFVAVTDLRTGKSWDINGKLLPKIINLGSRATGAKLPKGTRTLSAILEVSELNNPVIPRHRIVFHDDKGRLLPGFGVPGSSRSVPLIQHSVPLDIFETGGKAKTANFNARVASGKWEAVGSYKATDSGVTHEGFAFDPKVVLKGGKDEIYIGNPPVGMSELSTKAKHQFLLDGFDALGSKVEMSWVITSDVPRTAKPFGEGKMKSIRLSKRPWRTVSFKNIPLKPKK